jgi:DNA polymerase-3 subunit gamma/tau
MQDFLVFLRAATTLWTTQITESSILLGCQNYFVMVLYRKYRPQVLAEVLGQDHVRESLLASLKGGKTTHAYLFTGPRGTGKTSVARILAKAINCQQSAISDQQTAKFAEPCNECDSCSAITEGSHLDLLEIDAASNRGIDEIRDLREKIKLSPALGKFKVYIIDEAHMLTPEAFNALLKTLEEPPQHAVFILATTEPQKIPPTIASRTTRYDFKVPNVAQIKEKLSKIVQEEGWELPEESLEEIARMAGGAFRDAEVLLEKVASFDSSAPIAKTREVLGKKETTTTVNFLELIEVGRTKEALIWLATYVQEGGSVRILAENVLEALRKILLLKAGAEAAIGFVTGEEIDALARFGKKLTKSRLLTLTDLFNKAIEELRDATIPQLPLEIAIIEASLDKFTDEGEEDINIKNTQVEEIKPEEKDKNLRSIDKIKKSKPTGKSKSKETKSSQEPKGNKKATASQNKTLKKLQGKWTSFLKKVKPLNSSLEMFLRQAKPVDLDEDLLTLEFAYRFHKEKVEERKYREVIESALKEFTGSPLRIRGIVSPKVPEPEKRTRPKPAEAKEEVKKELEAEVINVEHGEAKVRVNAAQKILKLEYPADINPEKLKDAINKAMDEAQKVAAKRMQGMMGGLGGLQDMLK